MTINGTEFAVSLMEILQELKAELYANGIQLFAKITDSGDDVMVCCPYHKDGQERRPSAGIRKSDGLFHCLACGETHSLPEVISNCFGWNDPFGSLGYKWLTKNFLSLEVSNRDIIKIDCIRYNTAVKNGKVSVLDSSVDNQLSYVTEEELDSYRYIHPYMYERGLTDDIIDLFDIGYDAGTNSITFPVKDESGHCRFIARRNVDFKQFNIPRNVEKPLYGLYECNWTATGLKSLSEIYVCEGLFDCLRLWVNGKCAVAGFGCLFSDYQIQQLKSLPTRKLILATDNDTAGMQARKRLKQAITNKIITEVLLPDGKKDIGECTDDEIHNLTEIYH